MKESWELAEDFWKVEEMNEKITITISGSAGSGKTAIQQWLTEQLSTKFKQVDTNWGLDGNPRRDSVSLENCLHNIADRIQIVVETQQTKRHFGIEK